MESLGRGIPIMGVPVTVQSRSHGDSKKPRRCRYPIGFLRTLIRVYLRQGVNRSPAT